MMTSKVNVILSAYNGEKYIEEQLESLFAQDYPNVEIYVRDDGSSDRTIEILKKFEEEGKIHLTIGENMGFCASFFELLKETSDGDYWSFCDQDDIWKKDKIRRAVEQMEKQPDVHNTPLLYYSYSQMIDEHGQNIGIQKPDKGTLQFRRALTGTFGEGFSMVINRPLREAMLKCDPQQVHAHDWLAEAIALGLGRVIIDARINAYYRRLRDSVSRVSFRRRVRWFLNMLSEKGDVKERNMEFSKRFYDDLSDMNKRYMDLFNGKKYSFKAAIIKCFYPKRWRPSLSSEVAMRVLMLIGRV